MTTQHERPGPGFDPTQGMASERIQALQLEARERRLASHSAGTTRSPIRRRLGTALVALGSAMLAPAEPRRPSLVD